MTGSHDKYYSTYRFFDWPVREALLVAEMSQIVHVAKQLILQLWVLDYRHGTVLWVGQGEDRGEGQGDEIEDQTLALDTTYLVSSPSVAKQSRSKIADVTGNFLYHELPHFAVPDCLGCIKLPQERLTEFLRS